jgi:hypothetical protein
VLKRPIQKAVAFSGLTATLDLVTEFHPPPLIAEMWRAVLHREGDVTGHFPALIMYLYGRAKRSYDASLRPFFLRFNTSDSTERESAFRELCERVGEDDEVRLRTVHRME